jgi:predicted ATPase
MRRYILTGTPGSGKTTILRHLGELGYATVGEAATEVIEREQALGRPEPWLHDDFIDQVVTLQRRSQAATPAGGATVQFYDRSPVCTHALSLWLGREPSKLLSEELERITRDLVYQPMVFFVRNLGYCEPTQARRITYEQSLAFEEVHRESYRAFGYQLIDIPAAPAAERAAMVTSALNN